MLLLLGVVSLMRRRRSTQGGRPPARSVLPHRHENPLPLVAGLYAKSRNLDGYAQVWETWWPIERHIGGDVYRGLARSIEIKVPKFFNVEGYSLALNDGFGPNGSCDGVTSIGVRWGQPNRNIVTWTNSGDHSGWGRDARGGHGYHPDGSTLQTEPFLLYHWDARPGRKAGSLILSAERLYFSVSRANCDYLKFGVDGIWPNLTIDVAGLSGRRLIETLEYLYASEPKAGTPQHYCNARLQFGRRISEHYQLQRDFAATAFAQCGGLDGPIQKAGGSLEKAGESLPGSTAITAWMPSSLTSPRGSVRPTPCLPNIASMRGTGSIRRLPRSRGPCARREYGRRSGCARNSSRPVLRTRFPRKVSSRATGDTMSRSSLAPPSGTQPRDSPKSANTPSGCAAAATASSLRTPRTTGFR